MGATGAVRRLCSRVLVCEVCPPRSRAFEEHPSVLGCWASEVAIAMMVGGGHIVTFSWWVDITHFVNVARALVVS